MNLNCPLLRGCWERAFNEAQLDLDASHNCATAADYAKAVYRARIAYLKLFVLRAKVRGLSRALSRRDYASSVPVSQFAGVLNGALADAQETYDNYKALRA